MFWTNRTALPVDPADAILVPVPGSAAAALMIDDGFVGVTIHAYDATADADVAILCAVYLSTWSSLAGPRVSVAYRDRGSIEGVSRPLGDEAMRELAATAEIIRRMTQDYLPSFRAPPDAVRGQQERIRR